MPKVFQAESASQTINFTELFISSDNYHEESVVDVQSIIVLINATASESLKLLANEYNIKLVTLGSDFIMRANSINDIAVFANMSKDIIEVNNNA